MRIESGRLTLRNAEAADAYHADDGAIREFLRMTTAPPPSLSCPKQLPTNTKTPYGFDHTEFFCFHACPCIRNSACICSGVSCIPRKTHSFVSPQSPPDIKAVIGTEEENDWNGFSPEMCIHFLELLNESSVIGDAKDNILRGRVDFENVFKAANGYVTAWFL